MAHNHTAFMEKMQLISDKNERMRLMKEYWSGFSAEEYMSFVTNSLGEITTGLQDLIASDKASKKAKKNIVENLEKGVASVQAIKNSLGIPKPL